MTGRAGFLIATAALLGLVLVKGALAQPNKPLRLGYLETPGSALVLLAAVHGLYKAQGLEVTMVPLKDAASGCAALKAGRLDAAALPVGTLLAAIAQGAPLRIITGGGSEEAAVPLEELNQALKETREERGTLVAVRQGSRASKKATAIGLAAAIIGADLLLQKEPQRAWQSIASLLPGEGQRFRFDPNPDYWRLAEFWKRNALQKAAMPRDFLASHVYEEAYCDALDRLQDGALGQDPALRRLIEKAVCVPDCCPPAARKLTTTKGGTP